MHSQQQEAFARERVNESIEPTGASADAIRFHYDAGNRFSALWLDSKLIYSAAKWRAAIGSRLANSLEEAQEFKLDYHLQAINASSCRRVLDIGCGWGALLERAIAAYGVHEAIGITLSAEQAKYIRQQDFPGTRVLLAGYQDFEDSAPFDGITVVGAFEHFARPNLDASAKRKVYGSFFESCHRWLKPHGRISLQTICWGGVQKDRCDRLLPHDIFPESDVPFPGEVMAAANPRFETLGVENGREDYIETLHEWLKRLRLRRASIVERFGGEGTFQHYERYLRRAIAGFERKRMTLLRFIFEAR